VSVGDVVITNEFGNSDYWTDAGDLYYFGQVWGNTDPPQVTGGARAPDGSMRAAELAFAAAGDSIVTDYGLDTGQFGYTGGQTVTFSTWLSAASATTVWLYLGSSGVYNGLLAGDPVMQPCYLTNVWQRCSVTYTEAADDTSPDFMPSVAMVGPQPAQTVYVWGGQLELGSSAGPYVSSNGLSLGWGGTATFTTPPLAAGSHSITASYSGDGIFSASILPSVPVVVTVGQAVTAVITAANKTYDGTTEPLGNVTCTLIPAVSNLTCAPAAVAFATANAGNGITVTATGITLGGSAASNYTLPSTTATTTANIIPATPVVAVSCPVGVYSYYGAPYSCTGTVTGVGGTYVAGSFRFSPGGETNAGSYLETGTFTSTDSNYASGETASGTLTISQETLSASVTAANKVYDATTTEPLGNVTCTLTPVVSNLTCAATAAIFASPNVGAGNTVTVTGITLGGSAASNYSLSSTTATATASITPATPTAVSATCTGGVYNGTPYSCTGSATGVGGAAVAGTFAFNPGSETAVGSYSETGTFTSGNSNYSSGGTAAGTLVIGIATPTLTLSCPGGPFNNTAYSCTGTATGIGGATVTGTFRFSPASEINAGSYSETGTFTSTNSNYSSGGTASGTLVIAKATPTLTLSCPGATYSPTGSAHCTGSATGIGGVTVTSSFSISISPGSESNAGSYPETGTFTSSNSNYASGTANATLTIVPLMTTYTVAAASKIYDGTTAEPIGNVTCSLNYHVANLTCAGTAATFATANVGNSITVTVTGISLGGSASPNWVLASNTATATSRITALSVTPSVTAPNKPYDSTNTAQTNCNPNVLAVDQANVTCAAAAATFTSVNVGTGIMVTAAGITLGGSQAGNYTLSSATATTTANITVATPTSTATCTGGAFDGTAYACTGSATGIGGANVAGSFAFAPLSETNVGSYAEVGTFTSTNSNYASGGTASATLTIAQATPTLALTCTGGVYSGSPYYCSGSATGIGLATVAGSFSFSYTGAGGTTYGPSVNAPIAAGSYSVVGTFTSGNSNYASGGTANGTETIIPPLSISTASLPNGTLGLAYSSGLSATGGVGSYTWSIPSGQPSWLALNAATGAISGMPATGNYTFTVQVKDSNSPADTATKSLTIVVGSGPWITGLSATSGIVGASITITGLNFGATQGTSTVSFNGVLATVIKSWGANQIIAAVPVGAQNGNIVVMVAGQTSNTMVFVMWPSITGISIGEGPVQMGVVIYGYNFGAEQGTSTVMFDTIPATVVANAASPTDPSAPPGPGWSDTQITVQVPEGATTGGITVNNVWGTSGPIPFTVDPPFGCGQ